MNTLFKLQRFLLLIPLLLTLSCNSDDLNDLIPVDKPKREIDNVTYQKFPDVTKLYKAKGNKNAETVIIFEQGGPASELDVDCIEVEEGNPGLADHITDYYRVYAHQALTFDTKNTKQTIIDNKEALRLRELNIDILHNLIIHFKKLNKKIIVMGHSYGGFVIQQYLSKFNNNNADKFIIMSSRLEMPLKIATNFINLEPAIFKEDGKTIIPFDLIEDEQKEFFKDYVNMCPIESILAGYHTIERFTESIKIPTIENLLYVHALNDKQTGRLSNDELDFLKERKSQIIEIPDTAADGHSAPFYSPYSDKIVEFIKR